MVHINAGIAGLVGCLLVGKRKGYGNMSLAPHNVPFTMIGAALLWVGWFGFNVGSNLEANAFAAQVFINTFLATAAAVLAWAFGEWLVRGKPTMLGAASGAVAGLVAITPACGWVGPGQHSDRLNRWLCVHDGRAEIKSCFGLRRLIGCVWCALRRRYFGCDPHWCIQ